LIGAPAADAYGRRARSIPEYRREKREDEGSNSRFSGSGRKLLAARGENCPCRSSNRLGGIGPPQTILKYVIHRVGECQSGNDPRAPRIARSS
jgi:hypothetical protein